MAKHQAIARAAPRPRFRRPVTMIMLMVMIVCDVIAHRWGPTSPDVTRHLP
jgi:hypothetical protein